MEKRKVFEFVQFIAKDRHYPDYIHSDHKNAQRHIDFAAIGKSAEKTYSIRILPSQILIQEATL